MSDIKEKILTIRKVNFIGKWVEYWFEEEQKIEYDEYFKENIDKWIHCSKGYMLWDLVENARIYDEIMNHGFAGRKTKWIYESPNWNIKYIF